MELPRRSERLKRKREQQLVTEIKPKKLHIKKQKLEEPVQLKDITCLKKKTPIHNRYNAQPSAERAQQEQKISLRIRMNNKLYKIDNLQLLRRRLQDIYKYSRKSYPIRRAFI